MLTDEDKTAVTASWRRVIPIGETAASLFYRHLFELRPDLKTRFPPELTTQKRKLLQMLSFIVRSIQLMQTERLGRRVLR